MKIIFQIIDRKKFPCFYLYFHNFSFLYFWGTTKNFQRLLQALYWWCTGRPSGMPKNDPHLPHARKTPYPLDYNFGPIVSQFYKKSFFPPKNKFPNHFMQDKNDNVKIIRIVRSTSSKFQPILPSYYILKACSYFTYIMFAVHFLE